jgi:hypothetical protein
MKAHAAAQRVIDGIGKQVVQIDAHAKHEQQITLPPVLAVTTSDKQTRHGKMQKDMEDTFLPDLRMSGEFACLMETQLPALHLFAVAP